MNLWKVFTRGIIEENPYFVLALSLCPGLAVTTSIVNGLTMGCTVWFVITANNTVVSIIHKLINKKVRIPVYITCIATIVTCVQLFLQAFAPDLYKALGVYLDLVVVFAIILARAESVASKNGVVVSSTAWAWALASPLLCSSFPSSVKSSATVPSLVSLSSVRPISRL